MASEQLYTLSAADGARRTSSAQVRERDRRGFTLIELVLALALLIIILSTSYSIIVDSLQADQNLDRLTVPEKVGEGLLSLIRRDLGGTFFRNMGTRVFLVQDGGAGQDARDELSFLSTVEPTPIEGNGTEMLQLRTMTGIHYFLRPSEMADGYEGYTLFRKEIVEFDPVDPLTSPGINYELYSSVRYFSIECFDGWGWFENWESEARILEEQDAALEGVSEENGIARVSDPTATPNALANAPGVGVDAVGANSLLPPAAVPVAVRVELGIYATSRGKPLLDADGNPIIKTYSTIVPILTAQRIPLELDDGMGGMAGADGATGVGGDGSSIENPGGLTVPGEAGGRGPSGRLGGRFRGGGRFGARAGSGSPQPTRTDRLRRGSSGSRFGGGGGNPR